MRELKKEIETVKRILKNKDSSCAGIRCCDCPMYAALDATGNIGKHEKVTFTKNDITYSDDKRRWLRGWLSLAAGKPVKE